MTTEQTALQRLKFLHEKTTQQTWGLFPSGDWLHWGVNQYSSDGFYIQNIITATISEADANFIAIAHEVLPALIEYCEKLEQLAALVEPAQEIGWLEDQGWSEEHVVRVANFKIQHTAAITAVETAKVRLEEVCQK